MKIKILFFSFFCCVCVIFFSYTNNKQTNSVTILSSQQWLYTQAELYCENLSLETKAAQVLMTGIDGNIIFSPYLATYFKNCVPGFILLFKYNFTDNPHQTAAFLADVKTSLLELEPSIPIAFALDHEGGLVQRTSQLTTRLPSAYEIATTFSHSDAYSLYFHSAHQLALLGITLNLAPVVETLSPESEPFLQTRSFSFDSRIVLEYSLLANQAYCNGGISTAIKHFPGSGSQDPHFSVPLIMDSKEKLLQELEEVFIPLFNIDTPVVLASHTIVPAIDDVPFCLSKNGIQAFLRDELNYKGLVITDDISMEAIKKMGYSSSIAAIRALEAGCDVIMSSDTDIHSIQKAIITWSLQDIKNLNRLNEAVIRIVSFKFKNGLLQTAQKKYYDSRFPVEKKVVFDYDSFVFEKEQGDMIVRKHRNK